MRIRLLAAAASVAAAALSTTSVAAAQTSGAAPIMVRSTPGLTYFNRPGADMAAHEAALVECVQSIRVISNMRNTMTNAPNLATGLIWGAAFDAGDRMALPGSVENCMVAQGWRVIRLPEQTGGQLRRLSRTELSARLAAWVGAEMPEGEVARVFANEGLRGDANWTGRGAGKADDMLSLKTIDLRSLPAPRSLYAPGVDLAAPSAPYRDWLPETIADLPADVPVVLFKVISRRPVNSAAVTFRRATGDDFAVQGNPMGEMGILESFQGNVHQRMFKGRNAVEYVMAIPVVPGAYHLSGRGVVSFCHGSPVMDVAAGDVVYAGAFDITGPSLEPDMSLDPARAFLTHDPARAGKLRAAAWRNGGGFRCSGEDTYALRFPNAPDAPGSSQP